MNHYIALTKPRITWLILMSTGMGYYFGLTGALDWWTLLHTIVGTGLIASGTAALNQWYESDADARMRRTDHRPIPAGIISSRNAFLFGVLLSVLGFAELGFGVNWLSAGLGLFTLLS
jgi:heme o synthase